MDYNKMTENERRIKYKNFYNNNYINKAGGIICGPHFDKVLCVITNIH